MRTITSGVDAMGGQLVITDTAERQALPMAARTLLHETFGIDHSTIQVETAATHGEEIRMQVRGAGRGEAIAGGVRRTALSVVLPRPAGED